MAKVRKCEPWRAVCVCSIPMCQASCLDVQKSHSGSQCDVWIRVTGNEMRGVSYCCFKRKFCLCVGECRKDCRERGLKKGKDGCCLRHILNGSDDGSLSMNAT